MIAPLLLPADDKAVPAPALDRKPSVEFIDGLVARSIKDGWKQLTPDLKRAAFAAFEGRSGYASEWYYLYRWSAFLERNTAQATQQWIMAVNQAKLGHPNMPVNYGAAPGSLNGLLSREFQRVLLADFSFSEEFFTLLTPVDNPAQVLGILQKIYQAQPADFADYRSLALAIAVVYDVPPPPHWPHGQVSKTALPRYLPDATAAFAYWVRLDRRNFTMQRLRRLPASELKFMVDITAPFSELDWARRNVGPGLTDLAKAYEMVKYRRDRLEQNQYLWPNADYQLPTILAEGGICVDQAYFASLVGKSKGIPTIMFRGAGLDGRHAWFGYLDGQQRWQLDCGRFAEQKFVVGLAFDPQTWGDINDHELLFISERFREGATFKLSMTHARFAAEYLAGGQRLEAIKAAREAVNRERRNLDAWRTLLSALATTPDNGRAVEDGLREAKQAFQKYPDLDLVFTQQLTARLRARGETSLAAAEEQQLARKYQTNRADIGSQQAAAILEQSRRQDDLPARIRVYQQVLSSYGRGGGIDFYDKVVRPFVRDLQEEGQMPAAIAALERARKTLHLEPGGQLEGEMAALLTELKIGQR